MMSPISSSSLSTIHWETSVADSVAAPILAKLLPRRIVASRGSGSSSHSRQLQRPGDFLRMPDAASCSDSWKRSPSPPARRRRRPGRK